jgi:uncharacterized protein
MLKLSKFLHLIPWQDNTIAFSTLTGGMITVPAELADDLSGEDPANLQEAAKRCPELLVMGALINEDMDELDLIRVRMGRGKYGQKWLETTIAPTLACNMRCVYCNQPEDARSWIITDDIAEALITYIVKRLSGREGFSVTWYGGEPLLALDRLLSMQSAIYSLCKEYKVLLMASIVTNGLILDREIIKQLVESGIRQAQITLDGPLDVHDSRRKTKGGAGTFDRLLNNILNIRDLLDVKIRVNLDASNRSHLSDLIELLSDHNLVEKVYIAPVVGLNSSCAAIKIPFLNGSEFGSAVVPQINRLSDELTTARLTPGNLPCTAPSESSYVFGPRGHVYRCWHELGHPELAFDHVKNGDRRPDRKLFWLRYDPLDYSECAECNVLPLCLGGCPDLRQKGVKPPMCCTPLRAELPEFIRSYASRLKSTGHGKKRTILG